MSSGVLRVGVTGHRHFRDRDSVTAMIDALLDRLFADGAAPVLVTSLAEGADRLVARLCLERDGTIEVLLPLPLYDYSTDFATPESRAEFDDLLARATTVDVVRGDLDADRDTAYERAGHAVVDRVDVLIAVWDGLPARGRGGTAAIVQHALDRGIPVEVVLAERDLPE